MSQEITIPKLGLTMETAAIVEWHCEPGGYVAKGQPLLTIETEKTIFDVPAEGEGYLELVAAVGTTLAVGAVAGRLHSTAASVLGGVSAKSASPPTTPMDLLMPTAAPLAIAEPAVMKEAEQPEVLTRRSDEVGKSRLISPVARRVAEHHEMAVDDLVGTGPGGVILKRDVELAVRIRESTAESARPETRLSAVTEPARERRAMTSMRKTISHRMMQSLRSTAQMTGFGKIDMTEAVRWRTDLVTQVNRDGPRITYTDLVTKASACLLRDFPDINAYIEDDDIVRWNDIHIGIAVAVEGGLQVPVIHNVDKLSLSEISLQRDALVKRARSGHLKREDAEGGTFTVSNFGTYGGDFETPVLNTPQSALLGIGRISDEAVVRDKQIVIRAMMMISLTFDHRLIDGAYAGQFRAGLRDLLERPSTMFAQLR